MRRFFLLAAVAAAVLAGLFALSPRTTEAVCTGSMSYGDIMDCNLASGIEVDTFTFSGTSGETVPRVRSLPS